MDTKIHWREGLGPKRIGLALAATTLACMLPIVGWAEEPDSAAGWDDPTARAQTAPVQATGATIPRQERLTTESGSVDATYDGGRRSWLSTDAAERLPLGDDHSEASMLEDDARPSYRLSGMAAGDGETSLSDANRTFANPLARSTLFIIENNYLTLDGDATDDARHTNLLIVDPLIPMPLGDTGWTLVHRPILPFVMDADVPVGAAAGGAASTGLPNFENESGIGDFTYFAAFSPTPKGRVSWGVGPIFRFPTATDDSIGAEKFSMGPMGVVVYSGDKLTLGALNQNLFSVAGEDDRSGVAVSTLQYFAFYNFTPQWGIGTAPIISYDWNADSGDRLAFPIGLGVTRTFRVFDKVPARLLFEGQYYVAQRDTFGPEWNFRVALALFLPKAGGK